MSTPVFHPPPSVLSTPATKALDLYYRLWSDLPEKGEGEPIDWKQRFLLYPKIFASDAVLSFPFAASVVSPSMPVSPTPSVVHGLDEAINFYSKIIDGAPLTVLRSYELSVQPFPEAADYAWAQAKVDYEFSLPNGNKYLYQQQYNSQCRVNEQGLIVEYEEKWNPVPTINLFHALGAAMAETQAATGTPQTE